MKAHILGTSDNVVEVRIEDDDAKVRFQYYGVMDDGVMIDLTPFGNRRPAVEELREHNEMLRRQGSSAR